jgi:hypothetical protein
LDHNEEYFLIGSVTFRREGWCRFYNFSIEHRVKMESGENLLPHEREVLINCQGSIVHVKSYMMGGADWLPTWVAVVEHRQHVSFPLKVQTGANTDICKGG